jgi:hypothetical protein
MMPNTLFLEVARLRHEERIHTAERRSALLRTPMTRRLLTLVRRPDKGHPQGDDQQVTRVA